MENYVVSARKYRPQRFSDVVGQASITTTLENAIKSSHLAQAFLFCGPRGVGKTTCARILAKVVNTPEGEEMDPNEDFSFNIFELDAASNNSVDDIRSLTDQVRIPPQVGQFKVYIIDEAHMLSQSAFNAFLKTLEEPPPHAIFILATTEKHKIIPTILSRCQIFDFKRIEIKDMEQHLAKIASEEGIEAESDALHMIAEKADGALRDALSIFDQIVSFSGNKLSYESVVENLNILDYDYFFRAADHIRKHDIPGALLLFDEVLNKGFDGHHFINGLGSHYRNLLVCKDENTLKLLQVGDNIRAKYLEQSKKLSQEDLLSGLKVISKADVEYKSSKNQRLLIEIHLMQLCSIGADVEKKKSFSDRINIIPAGFKSDKSEPQIIDENPNRTEETTAADPKPVEPVAKEVVQVTEQTEPEETKVVEEIKESTSDNKEEKKQAEVVAVTETRKETNKSSNQAVTISIGAMLEEEELEQDDEEEDLSGKPRDEYDQNALKDWWKNYAKSLHEDGQRSFGSMLSKYEPDFDGDRIIMTLDNKAQLNEFNARKQDFLTDLRKEFNNYGITLEYSLEVKKTQRKYYTNKDKFERMVEMNPKLRELQKELGLDPDF
jgi:DNA polymerase-3 subunit gamma/tau